MRIVTVIGIRPEIIKTSQLIPLLDKNFEHTLIFTGQHYSREMVDVFFEDLKIRKPDNHLLVNTSEIKKLILGTYKLCKELKPNKIIVYGDSNSAYAGAVAGKKLNLDIIHIEAGLRSFDNTMPEEINRIKTDEISNILFPPTNLSKHFLEREGINENLFVVGNTIVDAYYAYKNDIEKSKILNELNLHNKDYILLTAHRQANVDNPDELIKIIKALESIDQKIIFPIHPRTKKRIIEFKIKLPSNVISIDPIGYFDFLNLLQNSSLVLTDSGGVQEEAITLKIPCLTVRNNTERWETIEAGGNFLVGTNPSIIEYYVKMILESDFFKNINNNPYGDGKTSIKITNILSRFT